jgi:hypothetical protein
MFSSDSVTESRGKTKKPIDRWLALAAVVLSVLLYLFPKTPGIVIGCLALVYLSLLHPVWNFWWIEDYLPRRIIALICMALAMCIIGFNVPLETKEKVGELPAVNSVTSNTVPVYSDSPSNKSTSPSPTSHAKSFETSAETDARKSARKQPLKNLQPTPAVPDEVQQVLSNLRIPAPSMPPFAISQMGGTGGITIMPGDALFETLFTVVNGTPTGIKDVRIQCRMHLSIADSDQEFPPTLVMRWPSLAGNGGGKPFRCFVKAKHFFGKSTPVTCADVGVRVEFYLGGQNDSKELISKNFRFLAASGVWTAVPYEGWQYRYCYHGSVIGVEPEP